MLRVIQHVASVQGENQVATGSRTGATVFRTSRREITLDGILGHEMEVLPAEPTTTLDSLVNQKIGIPLSMPRDGGDARKGEK